MKKILYIGSECTPYASTGGLGEVLGSLPASLKKADKDSDVRVVMPLYSKIAEEYRAAMKYECCFFVDLAWRHQYVGVKSLEKDGVIYYFIDNEYYFSRETLYGTYDDGERFAFFCRAALEMLPHIGFVPDVIHANDWQSALSVVYGKVRNMYEGTKYVYTIHNIEYQGVFSTSILEDIFDLPSYMLSVLEYDGCINLTKGAIVTADRVTTVSPRYSEEIGNPYFGTSLSRMIEYNRGKISGILNGIDYTVYNPGKDENIAAKYTKSNLKGKSLCKAELRKICSLPERPDVPVVVMVSRLASHKGFDLVRCVGEDILSDDIQLVLLGSGEKEYEDYFRYISGKYPDKAAALIRFDTKLAKKVYSGGDIFLMPSRSEPCGLAQMMASRYGTIPVVHDVGGLHDTIKPFNIETLEGNGFTFQSYNAHDMLSSLRRAEATYRSKSLWKKVMHNAMSMDFSWNRSALCYSELYENL